MSTNQVIAFKRNPDNPLKPIAVYGDARRARAKADTRDAAGGKYAKARLLHRIYGTGPTSPLAAMLDAHAPGILAAVRGAQAAPTPQGYAAHFRAFDEQASALMERIEAHGPQSRADAGLYTLLAPVYAMQEVLEQLVIDPMLINILPRRVLSTPLETGVYMEYTPGIGVAEASWEYGTGGAPVAAGKMTPQLVNLAPIRVAVEVSGREREVHEEMRGKMGAPAWDLFGKRMDEGMRRALERHSQIASYGDATLAGIYGLLSPTADSGITAANVNFDSGTGLTDRATIVTQVGNQAAAVGYDPRMVADTIIFDALSWYNLTGRGVSNTGDSDENVIGQVFKFRPEISEITYAIECGPTTAVTTALTPAVGATEAARLRGGYNDAGTTKRCMVILRNSPDVLAVMEGLPLSYEALDDRDGAIRGMIRGSSGGLRAFRKEAIRICYL